MMLQALGKNTGLSFEIQDAFRLAFSCSEETSFDANIGNIGDDEWHQFGEVCFIPSILNAGHDDKMDLLVLQLFSQLRSAACLKLSLGHAGDFKGPLHGQ